MNILILLTFFLFLCIVAFLVYQQIKPELIKSENSTNFNNLNSNISDLSQNQIYISRWLKDINIQQEQFSKISKELSKYIYGMEDVANAMMIWLITKNHVLISWYPGLAKTTSIKRFAVLLWLDNGRVQGSVDLLPSDITGQNIYNPSTNSLETRLWPINHNIVLVDEINRMTPKSQSALLQAMAESSISIDDQNYQLPEPFMVLATMNPHDDYGTFPMSAANLDRFALGIYVDRPSESDEKKIINQTIVSDNIDNIYSLTSYSLSDINQKLAIIFTEITNINIPEPQQNLILSIIQKTRTNISIKTWLWPRSSIYISQISKAIARLEWSDKVSDRHIYMSLSCVICHRLVLQDTSMDKVSLIYNLI